VTVDADVPESLGAVARLEDGSVAYRNDDVGLERTLGPSIGVGVVGRVDVAGIVECLAVDDGQSGVGGAEVGEPDPTVAVLAEIDDVATWAEFANFDRFEFFDAAACRPDG
jgi:hypothetical protein